MTNATAVDYPDFFRGEARINSVPLNVEVGVQKAAGNFTYGPWYVGERDQIVLFALSADQLVITIDHYVDQAATQRIATQTYVAAASSAVSDVVPIMAPYIKVTASFHVGAGTVNATLILNAMDGSRHWPPFVNNMALTSGLAGGVLAGATATQNPILVTTGKAILTIDSTAVSWVATLYATDQLLSPQYPVARIEHTALGQPCSAVVNLPAVQTQLKMTNNDAAARDFHFSVMIERGD